MTPPLTSAERAAELYPPEWVANKSTADQRTAYIRGHAEGEASASAKWNAALEAYIKTTEEAINKARAEGDAEGYARAIEACIEVVRTEEELDGSMPSEVIEAFKTTGPEEACRSIVRATKHSIEQRIRALAAGKE